MPTVNRKLASDKQRNTIVAISEQKNDPHQHFKVMSSLDNLTSSLATYELNRFAMKREVVAPKVYNINQLITEDPNWYLKNVQAEEDYGNMALYQHKLKIFRKGWDEKDVNSMALAYIELKDQPSFRKILEDEFPTLEKNLKEYISKLEILQSHEQVYDKLIIDDKKKAI